MKTEIKHWEHNKNAVSVNYGPLTFSLDIKERWSRYGGTDKWPEYEVFADSPWNYGLDLKAQSPENGIEIRKRKVAAGANPFTHAI